jgi:hypothetical protein
MTKRKNKKRPRFAKSIPAWTPFQNAAFPGQEQLDELHASSHGNSKHFRGVFINSRYQVSLYEYNSPWGPLIWLAIINKDRSARHDWRDFQRIKNELVGPDFEAMEMYPAETRLVDTNNQFHMFVLPKGKTFPIGFATRDVSDRQLEWSDHKQRPFDPVPEDLNTSDMEADGWPVFAGGESEDE